MNVGDSSENIDHDRRRFLGTAAMTVPHRQPSISHAARMAATDGANGEVKPQPHSKFADSRLGALVATLHTEMAVKFPSRQLFLDSVEQVIALALVNGPAVTNRPLQIARGGLGPARLRRIKEVVQGKMEYELSLEEMARSVGLSSAHFARMFRKSMGETPHQFVLRQRIERAKAMLRDRAMRILDVAVACGFKTQQHFAQVFRDVCGVRPTEYRQDVVGSRVACAPETCTGDTPSLEIFGARPRSQSHALPFTSLRG